MKLTLKELAQVEVLVARGDVKLWAAGADMPPALEKPISFAKLMAKRRANIGKARG